MTKKATHYSETPIEKWNSAHFQSYLCDQHVKYFGILYTSSSGIVAERNLIVKYIGTARKTGLYSKNVMKHFIDACFAEYKPTAQYPGLTFWFMVTYQSRLLQQAEIVEKREELTTQVTEEYEEVTDWL